MKLRVLVLLVLAGCGFGSLLTGASWLELRLPGGLPFGNLLAAIALCATAGLSVECAPGRTGRALAWASLLAATSWLPLSIAWAGNLELDFAQGRGEHWFVFSGSILGLVVLVLSGCLCTRMFSAARGKWAG